MIVLHVVVGTQCVIDIEDKVAINTYFSIFYTPLNHDII